MNSGTREPELPAPPTEGSAGADRQQRDQQAMMPAPHPAPMPVQQIAFWTPRALCVAIARLLLRFLRERR